MDEAPRRPMGSGNPNDIVFDLAARAGMPDARAQIWATPPEKRKELWQKILDAAKNSAATDSEFESIEAIAKGLGLPPPFGNGFSEPGSAGMSKLGGPAPFGMAPMMGQSAPQLPQFQGGLAPQAPPPQFADTPELGLAPQMPFSMLGPMLNRRR